MAIRMQDGDVFQGFCGTPAEDRPDQAARMQENYRYPEPGDLHDEIGIGELTPEIYRTPAGIPPGFYLASPES